MKSIYFILDLTVKSISLIILTPVLLVAGIASFFIPHKEEKTYKPKKHFIEIEQNQLN